MGIQIAPFSFQTFVVQPWQDDPGGYMWILLMGFLVSLACGLIGNYLVLRRMSLVGDAISHSVLPGIAVAFLISQSRDPWIMSLGAIIAGILTTFLIENIHGRSRIKQDAAIGITFTTLFAIGVILITLFAGKVDLDQECVLYGEISFVPFFNYVSLFGHEIAPQPVFVMGVVTLITAGLIVLFYKVLLVSCFDSGLAGSLGFNQRVVHYGMMSLLSVVVVSAFESVGAILVIAMLILPGVTAYLLTYRFPVMLALTVLHAGLSAFIGLHLGIWLECSMAGAMVVAGAMLFTLAWIFSPSQGLLRRVMHRSDPLEPPENTARVQSA
ncbi:MAG: manganese/zinc/iron transport system permease protein [Kiritimatiellia bacterium]|jgi:manganese/zinc/iron transport system permease protein